MSPITTVITTVLILTTTLTTAHNITDILSSDPDFSQFNSYLSQTKLSDEINSRQTITVLAVSNAAFSALTANNHPISVIKNLLSLHILLDYYDNKKLHSIQDGTVLTTTLYQTTGPTSSQNDGSVNITDSSGGSVKFGSGSPGSNLTSTYVKTIKTIPYNISVIQISSPIINPNLLTATSDTNITAVLDKAGCKTFASLIMTSGVVKIFETQMDKGITIFAPNDEAFKAKGVPDLNKLSNAELVSLLQFHALSSYSPIGTLKTTKGKLTTLASGAGKFDLSPSTAGDSVTLHTGVDSSRIASTALDSTPVVVYTVDNVLLPVALFGMSPSPAPSPESDTPSPSPSPKGVSPSPAESPVSSPPAPTPEGMADTPTADSPAHAAKEKAANGGVRKSGLVGGVLSVVFGVIYFVL